MVRVKMDWPNPLPFGQPCCIEQQREVADLAAMEKAREEGRDLFLSRSFSSSVERFEMANRESPLTSALQLKPKADLEHPLTYSLQRNYRQERPNPQTALAVLGFQLATDSSSALSAFFCPDVLVRDLFSCVP